MKATPYWWEHTPRDTAGEITPPDTADIAIVGAGFSGLSAALALARAGRSVVVYEAGQLGEGASSRNGGMVGSSFHKLGIAGLKAKYGVEKTNEIIRESVGFVDFIEDFLISENIDANFKRTGRFRGAVSASHFKKMSAELEVLREACGVEGSVINATDLAGETGSKRFCGGVVYNKDGGLHPAKFHNGLIAKLRGMGVSIIAHCPVTSVEQTTVGFDVHTALGTTKTERVALCTNAYTGPQFQHQHRRILPMRSAMIATARIAPDLMARLMPKGRVYGDSRRIIAYYRPSHDGTRILFGGRATGLKDNPVKNARQLRAAMCDIFPDLETTEISHVWSGLVGYTFDHAPHIGQHQGIDFAMGYCGSGVARATYFGQKLGSKILGNHEAGRTAFDDLPFQGKPLYTGNPWFMPVMLNWHRIADRLGL